MIKKDSKNDGLTIGIIFALCSFLLSFTLFVPIISVVPVGAIFEMISSVAVPNKPENVGKLTIVLLLGTSVLYSYITIMYVKKKLIEKQQISKAMIVISMFPFYFIVHPLGFYIYWGIALKFRTDGQLIFLAHESLPYSSLLFIPFGMLIDWTRKVVTKECK